MQVRGKGPCVRTQSWLHSFLQVIDAASAQVASAGLRHRYSAQDMCVFNTGLSDEGSGFKSLKP